MSIVIPNYNYGEFVAGAIESALGVAWPDVEVIVVDDGSTDDSREAIARYADRVTVIEQANAGPREACNAGFAVASGDVVIFLDSDDVLEPTIAEEVAKVWRPGISKVQVQMSRIDAEGRYLGSSFPAFRRTPTPEQVRHWMRTTSAYPTPPGSGNVYDREFLDGLFPIDDRIGDSTDSACLAAAPFLGDVVTIPKPLVRYRMHGNNRSALLADTSRFTRQVDRALRRHLLALDVSGDSGVAHPLAALFRGRHLLQLRIAERRMIGGPPPIPGDGGMRMLYDAIRSPFAPGPENVRERILISGWCLVVLTAPSALARRLVESRFRQPRPAAPRTASPAA